jgi:hypothetical protein
VGVKEEFVCFLFDAVGADIRMWSFVMLAIGGAVERSLEVRC